MREAFFPSAVQHYAIETARADDGPRDRGDHGAPRVRGRGRRACAPGGKRCRARSASRAARAARSSPSRCCASSRACRGGCWPTTRCASPGGRTCARSPWRRASEVLLARQTLAWATGAASSPCFAALLRDLERASLAAGPSLRRVYSAARGARDARAARPDRVRRARAVPTCFGYRPILLDLGPESAVSWLSALAARDLDLPATGLDDGAARAAPRRRPDRALQARVRRDALPDRPRGPAGGARHAPARRLGLRVDGRLERRRRRDLRACGASSATRPARCRPFAASGTGSP